MMNYSDPKIRKKFGFEMLPPLLKSTCRTVLCDFHGVLGEICLKPEL